MHAFSFSIDFQDTWKKYSTYKYFYKSAKFRRSRAIVGLVGLLISYLRTFVGSWWVQNFFTWVFRWVQNFFSWAFHWSITFPRGYVASTNIFLVDISWVQNFSREYFVAIFVIQRFPFPSCMRKSDSKQKYVTQSHTAYSIPNWFQQLSVLPLTLETYFSTKLVMLCCSFHL